MINYKKKARERTRTTLVINQSIIGDSLEVQLERLAEGEGIDTVQDRDLVYNDNETNQVNPITNIRTDKFDTMLEEKIGEFEWRHRKQQNVDNRDPLEEEVKIEE